MNDENKIALLVGMGIASLILVFTATHAESSERSVFSRGNVVYQMHYSTHFTAKKRATEAEYLVLAVHHNDFTVGSIAYNKDKENSFSSGAPLRKKGDVKVNLISEVPDSKGQKVDIAYSYDGEVVLDQDGLTNYTLYFPLDLEATDALGADEFSSCSLGAYATYSDILPIYWTPFNRYCEISNYSVNATLSPLIMKTTYPDYPRLVKDGSIQIALLIGKMVENADHNPYRLFMGDESRTEYQTITKHLKKMGFERTSQILPDGLDTSYEETLEANFNGIKFVVKMVYGNSVNATEAQRPGITDFYLKYFKLAKESSYVVYSGHAGFLVAPDGVTVHAPKTTKFELDPDRYQIFVMNGCQTNDYIYPLFALKSPNNIQMFLNARESIVNANASTVMIDAMVSWANFNYWTKYSDLVSKMDSVNAMLGVVGDQSAPTEPYGQVPGQP